MANCLSLINFTSMVGFFSKKQYVAIADNIFAMKLLNERCLILSSQCSLVCHNQDSFVCAEYCRLIYFFATIQFPNKNHRPYNKIS